MKVETGKLYLTKIGRVINLIEKDGELYDCRHCNFYTTNGLLSRCGKDSIVQNNLKIVEELPFEIPLTPDGYTWASGYPQFRMPEEGEFFITYNSKKKKFGNVVKRDCTFQVPAKYEQRRFIVKPIEQKMPFGASKAQFLDFGKRGTVISESATKSTKTAMFSSEAQKLLQKTSPSLKSRAFTYWIVEPSINLIRNAFVIGIISGGVYTFNHTSEIKNFFYKCLPTISISVDSPNITKGQ